MPRNWLVFRGLVRMHLSLCSKPLNSANKNLVFVTIICKYDSTDPKNQSLFHNRWNMPLHLRNISLTHALETILNSVFGDIISVIVVFPIMC